MCVYNWMVVLYIWNKHTVSQLYFNKKNHPRTCHMLILWTVSHKKELLINSTMWLHLKTYWVEVRHKRLLGIIWFHLCAIYKKGRLYRQKSDQWFPRLGGKGLNANGPGHKEPLGGDRNVLCLVGADGYRTVSRPVVSDCSQPHELKPIRLLCPWNLQARILEWVAIPFSRDPTQGWNPGLLHCR